MLVADSEPVAIVKLEPSVAGQNVRAGEGEPHRSRISSTFSFWTSDAVATELEKQTVNPVRQQKTDRQPLWQPAPEEVDAQGDAPTMRAPGSLGPA